MTPPADPCAAVLHALEADLVGPLRLGDDAEPEVLPLPPSRWYLTGLLACAADRDPADATSDDALGAGPDEDDEDADSQEP
ncbi:MAG: hypothetical protein IPM79_17885 [Polyangiaceae bacterium]|nr:hypothetical protein [Polyangiaceae bacterium]MBK8939439.1 hypothetical protein [Polyangiaceae bacterium]